MKLLFEFVDTDASDAVDITRLGIISNANELRTKIVVETEFAAWTSSIGQDLDTDNVVEPQEVIAVIQSVMAACGVWPKEVSVYDPDANEHQF